MNYKTLRFLMPALGAALLLSCEVEELMPVSPDHGEEITPVTVSLQLALDSERNGTPQTRAIDDPIDEDDTRIHNLCILQYNGTGDDAPLVGDVHYLRSDADPDDEDYLNLNAVKLADSWGAQHTLVVLTNTFTKLGGDQIRTLGGMLSLWRTVGGEPDVFGHTGQGEGFPEDTDYYQRMNAIVVSVIQNEATIKGTLRRSMARVNVIIENNGKDGLQIQKVQLRNASMKDYYVTDYSFIDENDDEQLLRDTPFQDEYIPGVPMRADYSARTWADGGGTNDGSVQPGVGTGTATYRWYVASNMRGTSGNTLPSEKNMSLNASGATYLWILATYGTNHDEYIVYKFYLGENLVNDFNLKPNHSYTYRLTFDGRGNTVTDKRIDDYGTVNFTLDANCYIINPPVEGTRRYTFNVVHRPNTFWGGPTSGDRYGYYNNSAGQYPSNFIGTEEPWHARILWSDASYTMNDVLTRNTGNGGGDYMDDSQRVELTIPSNITQGNLVIGVWTGDDPNVILWSWHIWITDYQPDDIQGHAPDEGTFLYQVEGGEVHRYNGSTWTTGIYENAYAMDRNLGALDQKYHSNGRGEGMYYQFGRKDPFPAEYTIFTYNASGNASTDAVPKTAYNQTGQASNRNVPWSVNHPRNYLYNNNYGSWTENDNYSSTTNEWSDPKISENDGVTAEIGKSFFDPCPPGWQVPLSSCYDNFIVDNDGSSTTNPQVTFVPSVEEYNGHNRGSGFTYYPNTWLVDKDNVNAQTAFFPSSGYRNRGGGLNYHGTNAGFLTSDAVYKMYYRINNAAAYTKSTGYAVRCVRKNYQQFL